MAHAGSGHRESSRNLTVLTRLAHFLHPYRGLLVIALVALLIAAAATLSLPVGVRYVVDRGFIDADPAAIRFYFLALFVISAFLAVFSALRFYLVSRLGERVIADIRARVYRHVITMSPGFFETTRTGEVLSRLTTDTTLVQSIVGAGISMALRSIVVLIGGLIMLGVTSPRLTAFIVILIPVVVLPIMLFGRRVRRLSRDSQDSVADASALGSETLNAIPVVQAFNLEGYMGTMFANFVEAAYHTALRRIRARALLTAFAIITVFGSVSLVLWMGAKMVLSGALTAGELSQFVLYAVIIAGATAMLGEVWGDVQRAAGAMERILELLAAEAKITLPAQPVALPQKIQGRIAFRRVSFAYPARPDREVLSDFDLSVEPGETVALVGPSGAGKSTVFQLLLRFYDVCSGSILIDGVDTLRADPQAIRACIGIVPQETIVFAADALENIRLGKPQASDDEVKAAAAAALVDEFIERQPEGYATFLGERGMRLSGGQKQRIAIARAILKNAPILLLDEATSALDAHSEALVQEALEHAMARSTTLVIAHRLATVLKSDRIVVMDNGRIVAAGSHEALTKTNALYARLAALQFGTQAAAFGAPRETLPAR